MNAISPAQNHGTQCCSEGQPELIQDLFESCINFGIRQHREYRRDTEKCTSKGEGKDLPPLKDCTTCLGYGTFHWCCLGEDRDACRDRKANHNRQARVHDDHAARYRLELRRWVRIEHVGVEQGSEGLQGDVSADQRNLKQPPRCAPQPLEQARIASLELFDHLGGETRTTTVTLLSLPSCRITFVFCCTGTRICSQSHERFEQAGIAVWLRRGLKQLWCHVMSLVHGCS
mmetsp:Transcript_154242/g.287554  ORF Transcript_154242/g.287554 Transcript_154242/m.287554 type:complete len:230 (+) Transcript_154242:895-1584(+)